MEKYPRITATAASIAIVVMVLTDLSSRAESVNKVTNFSLKITSFADLTELQQEIINIFGCSGMRLMYRKIFFSSG